MNNTSAAIELAEYLAAPAPATWTAQFREGAAAPWRGLRFLNRRPALWRYAVAPVLVNLCITGLVLAALIATVAGVLRFVHPWFEAEGGAYAWIWRIGEFVAAVALLIVCLGAAVVVWKVLTGVLCGYFYGVLANHVEQELGLRPDELHDLSLRYQAIDTAYDLAALVSVHAAFFAVGLLPLLGAPLALVGDLTFTWFILGLDCLDFPLAMRGWRRHEKRRFCRKRLPYTLGLGAVVYVMQFVPVVGSLFLTTAVVGAVLLHRRLTADVASIGPGSSVTVSGE